MSTEEFHRQWLGIEKAKEYRTIDDIIPPDILDRLSNVKGV